MHKPTRRLILDLVMLSQSAFIGHKPHSGMLKVKWDATLDCNNKKMGLGVVVRDYAGEVQAVLSTTVHYIIDPSVAEALVIWKAVSFCSD